MAGESSPGAVESGAEAGERGEGGERGEREEQDQMEAYAEFRTALEALPDAPAFQALVVKYGQRFGFRAVGRWIAGRAPKPRSGE